VAGSPIKRHCVKKKIFTIGTGKNRRLAVDIKKTKSASSGLFRAEAVTFCVPTGRRLILKKYGKGTFS